MKTDICKHYKRRDLCRICFTHPDRWCITCKDVWVYRGSYNPYCFHCYHKANPDVPATRQGIKENFIHNFLQQIYPDIIHSKTVSGGSSSKRPDWLLDLGTHCVIIECDENEILRLREIWTDLNKRPLSVIRFNPDKYTDSSGCFSYDSKNQLVVDEKEWKNRSDTLLKEIEISCKVPWEGIGIFKLFYN